MLSSIQTTNYRNLHIPDGVSLDPLTIFIGPNGSGKSNVVRVLRFLNDTLVGFPDPRRGVSKLEDAIAKFGSGRARSILLETPAIVALRVGIRTSDNPNLTYGLDIVAESDARAVVRGEILQGSGGSGANSPDAISVDHQSNGKLLVRWRAGDEYTYTNMSGGSGLLALREMTAQGLSAHRLNTGPSPPVPLVYPYDTFPAQTVEQFIWVENALNALSSVSIYDALSMNLAAIKRATPELGPTDSRLSPDGDNLVTVLHNLMRDEPEFEDRILEAMRELFPATTRLRVVAASRTNLQLQWRMRASSKEFFLDEISNGTVFMLCWAAVLLSPNPPSLIVLDEPEAGIHPAWLRVLAGWIRDAARRTQVIVSTHSSDLLDYFTDDVSSVRVFHQDTEAPQFYTVTALQESDVADKLIEGWKLGDLYRVRDPSVGGWPW